MDTSPLLVITKMDTSPLLVRPRARWDVTTEYTECTERIWVRVVFHTEWSGTAATRHGEYRFGRVAPRRDRWVRRFFTRRHGDTENTAMAFGLAM